MGNLGTVYAKLENFQKALECYKARLAIAEILKDRKSEGISLFNMSISFRALGQREKSVSLAKSALAIFEQIDSPSAENVRQKLAEWSA